MRFLLRCLALHFLAISPASAQKAAEAFLVHGDGDLTRVWITAATATTIHCQESEQASDTLEVQIAGLESIYIVEPPALSEAIKLYQARHYSEARRHLTEVKTAYKAIAALPENPSTQAAYWELECLRKAGDLDGLSKALETFDRVGLTREHQIQQVELYAMWEAVRTKDWGHIERICTERLKERVPGYQRAQIGYCLGLALDSQEKWIPAINAYNIAMTADSGASEDLARSAALKSLRLYRKNPAFQEAIQQWDAPGIRSRSAGRHLLGEAAALARLYQLSLGGGSPLPDEFKDLLLYLPKSEPAKPVETNEPDNDK